MVFNATYLFIWIQRHFQQHFIYIVVVSFISGENRSTRRKPPTCRKSQNYHIIFLNQVHFAKSGIRTLKNNYAIYVICMYKPYNLLNYVCQDFVVVNQCTYRILINDVFDLLILVHRRSKHTEDLVTTKDSIQWKTNKYQLVGTVLKFHRKFVKRGKIATT